MAVSLLGFMRIATKPARATRSCARGPRGLFTSCRTRYVYRTLPANSPMFIDLSNRGLTCWIDGPAAPAQLRLLCAAELVALMSVSTPHSTHMLLHRLQHPAVSRIVPIARQPRGSDGVLILAGPQARPPVGPRAMAKPRAATGQTKVAKHRYHRISITETGP